MYLEYDNTGRQQLLANVELKLCDSDVSEKEISHGIAAGAFRQSLLPEKGLLGMGIITCCLYQAEERKSRGSTAA
jgi:hypothetical protein